MDKSYEYEEDEYEEGLTFKKVGHFFLKGWVRMIAYAVVLVLVTAIVALPIKIYYKSEPAAQTSVEFIYKGVEEGLDPNGGTLNTDNIIAPSVLSAAVDAAELSETITDISELRGRMRVEAVPTEEYLKLQQAATDGDSTAQRDLLTYEMFPTRFTVVLSEPKKLNLSDSQATLLLDKVVAAYFDSFKTRYSVTALFSTDIYNLSADKTLEFTDAYDEYESALASISSALTLLNQSGASFVSQAQVTFSALSSELSTLELSYDRFNDYVLDNNIWRNKTTAKKNFDDTATRLAAELDAKEAYAASLAKTVEGLKLQIETTTGGGEKVVTETMVSEYNKYVDMKIAADNDVVGITTRIANNGIRIETIKDAPDTTDPALIANAEATLASLEARSSAFVKKVNDAIDEYYDKTIVASSVRQVQPSVVTRKSSGLNVVIILLVAAAVGVVAGGIVTVVKISKANAAAENSVEDGGKAEAEEKPEAKK